MNFESIHSQEFSEEPKVAPESIEKQEVILSKESIEEKFLELEKLKAAIATENISEVSSVESLEDKGFNEQRDRLVGGITAIADKIASLGYDSQTIISFQNSENATEKLLYDEVEQFAESLDLSGSFSSLLEEYPAKALDLIYLIKIPLFQREIFHECIKKQEVSTRKIIDAAFTKIITPDNESKILEDLNSRIAKDKQEALMKFSVEEILTEWEKENPTDKAWSDAYNNFCVKTGERLDELSREGNVAEINSLKERIDALRLKSDLVPYFSGTYPIWLKRLNVQDGHAVKLLTREFSGEDFEQYFGKNSRDFVPFHLVPDSLSEEKKLGYYTRVFLKDDLTGEEVKEYATITNQDILEVIERVPSSLFAILRSENVRKEILGGIISQYKSNEESNRPTKDRMRNILESFLPNDNKQELPYVIQETLERFETKYGHKGQDIIALALSAYGTEHPEYVVEQMKAIEQVLDRYDPDSIPEGAKVSMGIEYEVTSSIADTYDESSILGYKKDIELVSHTAHIGKGNGGIHEIAPKPNYNPYMLMAEIKLLQDAGFLDLNFEKYSKGPRGYHLSLVGDTGLEVNKNMYFLNNVLTMAQLTGITAGKEIKKVKDIHKKSFEHFSDTDQRGVRCEMKGMATDSIEQFEKTIITGHHAGIAIQLSNKYVGETIQFADIGKNPEAFEQMLVDTNSLITPFHTDQERDIVYAWAKLNREIADAVGRHNESFIDSEFNGYAFDVEGNYIDTGEHIDIVRNKKLVDQTILESQEFKDKIHINVEDLYVSQESRFVNALTNTNNIFLKPPQAEDNSPVNAKAVLDTVKQEGYSGIVDRKAQASIFEYNGELREGYYYTQGASEEMIIHKAQILLNHFNKSVEQSLLVKGVERVVDQNNLVAV